MPSLSVQTEVTILLKRPPSEKFVPLTVLGAEHGCLVVHQRSVSKLREGVLDLFDDADVVLSSSNQGKTWFVTEAYPRRKRTGIGRSYDSLREASLFTGVLARNPVSDEERVAVLDLARKVLDAFNDSTLPPEVIRLKALYTFARVEGYPVRQQWLGGLSSTLRPVAEHLLRVPLADLANEASVKTEAPRITERLEAYLRAHTEILLE